MFFIPIFASYLSSTLFSATLSILSLAPTIARTFSNDLSHLSTLSISQFFSQADSFESTKIESFISIKMGKILLMFQA